MNTPAPSQRFQTMQRIRVVICAALLMLAGTVMAQSGTTTPWPWSQLTSLQKQVLAPFKNQWNQWATGDKRAWVLLANRFPKLSAKEKARAEKRISKWAALTPAQRAAARDNIRLSRELQRDDRVAEWERYQRMTKEQKSVLRENGRIGSAIGNSGVRSGLASDAAQPLAPRK